MVYAFSKQAPLRYLYLTVGEKPSCKNNIGPGEFALIKHKFWKYCILFDGRLDRRRQSKISSANYLFCMKDFVLPDSNMESLLVAAYTATSFNVFALMMVVRAVISV